MIKYRPQRGSLHESMNELVNFFNIADMLRYIETKSDGMIKAENIIIKESNGEDERINWKSWRSVCVTRYGGENYDTPQCIGMCDLGERE